MIGSRIHTITEALQGTQATLIAVSKKQPVEAIQQAYDAGQRHFGESYAQELRDKAPQLPADICWHFIGRLQRNKLKYIAPVAYRVHGITRVEQAKALAKRRPGIAGLINVNLGRESNKTGVEPQEALDLARSLGHITGFELAGLMCIPPFTAEASASKTWFEALAELAAQGRAEQLPLHELSMGMSRDWRIAVPLGAHWVRVGTAIFGVRT